MGKGVLPRAETGQRQSSPCLGAEMAGRGVCNSRSKSWSKLGARRRRQRARCEGPPTFSLCFLCFSLLAPTHHTRTPRGAPGSRRVGALSILKINYIMMDNYSLPGSVSQERETEVELRYRGGKQEPERERPWGEVIPFPSYPRSLSAGSPGALPPRLLARLSTSTSFPSTPRSAAFRAFFGVLDSYPIIGLQI